MQSGFCLCSLGDGTPHGRSKPTVVLQVRLELSAAFEEVGSVPESVTQRDGKYYVVKKASIGGLVGTTIQ